MGIGVVWSGLRVEMVCTSICGYNWFVGIGVGLIGSWVRVVCGFDWFVVIGVVRGYRLGLWISMWLRCGYQRGCAVVCGYRCGSICLISVKFCCGLISDLVQIYLFIYLFFAVVVCGCGVHLG